MYQSEQVDVDVMQKAVDIASVAERYMVAGDLDGAAVLTDMAAMYVAMARELRIGNRRMTRPSTRSGAVTPVYAGTITRKTVTWDVTEPLPVPEPNTGGLPQELDGDEGVSVEQAFGGGFTGTEVDEAQGYAGSGQDEAPTGLSDPPAPTTSTGEPWVDPTFEEVVIDGGEAHDADPPLDDAAPGVPLSDDENRG